MDYIYLFDEDTPEKYFDIIRPDVYLLGSDWEGSFVGKDILENIGTKIVVDNTKIFSTTNIISKIQNLKNSKKAIFYFNEEDIEIIKNIDSDFKFRLESFDKEKIFELSENNDVAINGSFIFTNDTEIIKKSREINLRNLTV